MFCSPARALQALLLLGPLALPAAAAPHFSCEPGSVAFETVHLPDRNVVFLRRGPGCPQVAPHPPAATAVMEGPTLIDDAGEGGAPIAAPSSALHVSRAEAMARTAGLGATTSFSAMVVIGIVTSMVLLAMAAIGYMGRSYEARPHPVAKSDVEAQLEDDGLCKAAMEEGQRLAREAAERKAREEAEQEQKEIARRKAQEQIAPLAPQELQKPVEEEPERPPVSARSSESLASSERGRRPVYDDNTRAFQLAQQAREQQQRKSQEESDRVLRQEIPEEKPEATEQKAGGCGPLKCKACASKRGASEPAARRARK